MFRSILKESKRLCGHFCNKFTDYEPKIVILAYHRILPVPASDPWHMSVTLDTFIKQLEVLAARYPIISLTEALRQGRLNSIKAKISVVLSFDDGYRDIYDFVFPALKKKGLCGAFFLPTDYINKDTPLWEWEVMALMNQARNIRGVRINGILIAGRFLESKRSFVLNIIEKMKSLKLKARAEVMDSLRRQIGIKLKPDHSKDLCITWEEARKLSEAGMEIGSHGATHSSLARIPFHDAEADIKLSKHIIEQNINKPCRYFAFPFGSIRDYNGALINCVRQAGFEGCLLNVHGYNRHNDGIFSLKRIIVEEGTDLRHLLG